MRKAAILTAALAGLVWVLFFSAYVATALRLRSMGAVVRYNGVEASFIHGWPVLVPVALLGGAIWLLRTKRDGAAVLLAFGALALSLFYYLIQGAARGG